MSAEDGSKDFGLPPGRLRARELICVAITVLSGTLITGIAALIAAMASVCIIAPANRCFSVSRDTAGAILNGIELWLSPALVVAVLLVTLARFRSGLTWWKVLIAAMASMSGYVVAASAMGAIALSEAFFFILVGCLVLFVGAQLSVLFGRSVIGLSC